jgi:hypothetical protein
MKKKITGHDIVKRAIARQTTAAQKTLKKATLLNERPEGMSFEQYKLLRRQQTKAIRNSLR